MCGICGVLYFDRSAAASGELLTRMADTMRHRGPDDAGVFTDGPCGFGHRRLSIIDLAAGRQPMTLQSDGGSLTIVFNGEIYNYLELREELLALGNSFSTRSDTEVILHGYRQWGSNCAKRLRGMFAFAIWDGRARQLFLARDRIGEKPLYYYSAEGAFLFGSEVKSLLASGLIAARMDERCLDAFVTVGYVPAPLTMFKGIRKLLPGHTLTVSPDGGIEDKPYWALSCDSSAAVSPDEARERLDELLLESVRMRLMSEVPLGVFLSGGLDSSAIVSYMHRVSGSTIKTFSVGYENAEEANELEYARRVAALFDTEHHEFILKPENFFDFIPRLVETTEEPLVETAAIPLFFISQMAKPHATVLLSGEGSDEIFAGYQLYQTMLRLERSRWWGRALGFLPPWVVSREKIDKYIDWYSLPVEEVYRGISADVTPRIRRSLYAEPVRQGLRAFDYLTDIYGAYFRDVAGAGRLQQMLYVDLKTWLVDDLLLKADKMTMAASVELRVPFLDHKVVEYAASLPGEYKILGDNGKHILKETLRSHLPPDIVFRKKMGFPVPARRWFGNELLGRSREILLGSEFLERGYFQRKYLERMFKQQESGREDFSRRIFSMLVLNQWHRSFGV